MANVKITHARAVTPEDKLSPQAMTIMTVLAGKAHVGHTIHRDALVEELTANETNPSATHKLNTRQDPARIFTYYVPKLVTAGLIHVEKIAAEPEPKPKAEKAPKAEKPAGRSKAKAEPALEAAA